MARHVFFSFHFDNDVWRANQVRNSWVTQGKTAAGYIDSVEFEKIEIKGKEAVRNWIDNQLIGTTVTVVLIGSETCYREYVRYEVKKSYERGNAIIGVHISKLKDNVGKTSLKGNTIFGELGKDRSGNPIFFNHIAKEYDYVTNLGYYNIGKWIEEAANSAGK